MIKIKLIKNILTDSYKLLEYVKNNDSINFINIYINMKNKLDSFKIVANNLVEKDIIKTARLTIENILNSLDNAFKFYDTKNYKCEIKIEFELIPLIEEFYYNYYYFRSVKGHEEREKYYYEYELMQHNTNKYIEESMKKGIYKYEVSIFVLAHNKLEYTKQCVNSIFLHMPKDLNYEIFFINSGSNDGTKEYFDSFGFDKTVHLLHNNFDDIRAFRRIIEGRYLLSISNDIIVTKNYLDNLLKCIKSNDKISIVVPTTCNVSNRQSIPANYKTLEEMHEFASNNNISNPNRWEERVRLCNPISLFRSKHIMSSKGVNFVDNAFIYSEFSDDALALRFRRNGYKMILAKDCYCHHFGSVSLKEKRATKDTLGISRSIFYEKYKVDAWNQGFCYDEGLINSIDLNKNELSVLGINSGFGSNPLKIREARKELRLETNIFYITDDINYIPDLNSYGVTIYSKDIINSYIDNKFDYILIEYNAINIISFDNIDKLKDKLNNNGILLIRAMISEEDLLLSDLNSDRIIKGDYHNWYLWEKK